MTRVQQCTEKNVLFHNTCNVHSLVSNNKEHTVKLDLIKLPKCFLGISNPDLLSL